MNTAIHFGSVFFCLVAIHFFSYFMFNIPFEKDDEDGFDEFEDAKIVFSFIYSKIMYIIPFLAFMLFIKIHWAAIMLSLIGIIVAGITSEYIVPFVWAKHIRNIKEMRWSIQLIGPFDVELIAPDPKNNETNTMLKCGVKTWREKIMMDMYNRRIDINTAQQKLDFGGFEEFRNTVAGYIAVMCVNHVVHCMFLAIICILIIK